MDAKQCEATAEHERKKQHGGPPVKGNWRTSIDLGMEMINHATTANKTEANGNKTNGSKQKQTKQKRTKRKQRNRSKRN